MGPGGGTAGAMLVRDGWIAAVGDPAQVRGGRVPGGGGEGGGGGGIVRVGVGGGGETVLGAYAAALPGSPGASGPGRNPRAAPDRARRGDVPGAHRPGRGTRHRDREPARVPVRPGRRVRGGVPRPGLPALRVRVLAAGGPHRRRVLGRPGDQRRSPARHPRRHNPPLRRRAGLGPGERLTARDALALYTTEAAAAMHREHEIGSLEPGKLADFVVLAGTRSGPARSGSPTSRCWPRSWTGPRRTSPVMS